jgi:hypothetical protein
MNPYHLQMQHDEHAQVFRRRVQGTVPVPVPYLVPGTSTSIVSCVGDTDFTLLDFVLLGYPSGIDEAQGCFFEFQHQDRD